MTRHLPRALTCGLLLALGAVGAWAVPVVETLDNGLQVVIEDYLHGGKGFVAMVVTKFIDTFLIVNFGLPDHQWDHHFPRVILAHAKDSFTRAGRVKHLPIG